MNRADRDFAENLVLAVKKRPAIYAPSHPNHKDRYKIDLEWTGIAAELNSTVESVKRRWQNLRGSFSKSLSAMKNQSGGSDSEPRSSFYLFQQMLFLKQHMANASMRSSYGYTLEDQDLEQTKREGEEQEDDSIPFMDTSLSMTVEEVVNHFSPPSPTPSVSSPAANTSRSNKRPRLEQALPWEEVAAELFKFVKNRNATIPREDYDLSFFKGLLPMVRGLRQKQKVKFFGEVTTLLFNHIEQQESEEYAISVNITSDKQS